MAVLIKLMLLKIRIETVDGDEISRPGPRIDEGLKDLRDDIYKNSHLNTMYCILLR